MAFKATIAIIMAISDIFLISVSIFFLFSGQLTDVGDQLSFYDIKCGGLVLRVELVSGVNLLISSIFVTAPAKQAGAIGKVLILRAIEKIPRLGVRVAVFNAAGGFAASSGGA